MDERARRLALNEAFFREVNEQIQSGARGFGDDGHSYEYMCECSNVDCTFMLPMTQQQYEHVRSNGAWFAIVPAHNLPEIEDVVARHESYWIVSKRGETGEFVAMRDPRRA